MKGEGKIEGTGGSCVGNEEEQGKLWSWGLSWPSCKSEGADCERAGAPMLPDRRSSPVLFIARKSTDDFDERRDHSEITDEGSENHP